MTRASGHHLTARPANTILGMASLLLALFAIAAIVRGRAEWAQVPLLVWVHLATILTATLLTPVMLLRRKGDRRHRRIGYVWIAAMIATAATSLFFNTRVPAGHGVFSGDFSVIHLLSVVVLAQVPVIVISARAHNIVRHERAVRALVIGALLIAGFFTFPFNRMLGAWLFG
jgi:uncharacterized membrane protein